MAVFVILIVTILYVFGVSYFRRRRAWLGYYLFASLGLVLIIVFGAQSLGLADKIESLVTYLTSDISSKLGMQTQFLGGGTYMVADKNGWVALRTTIECSALIESAVLLGLVAFYPAFHWRKKIAVLSIGLPLTWATNIVRLLIITAMVSNYGRSAIFLGHAVVGRLFFLIVTVTLYWFILTMPTIKLIGDNVAAAEANS
jgi:exosortase family protein XrtG